MKKMWEHIIRRINLLLGMLVGVLTGCSMGKRMTQPPEVMVMYGIPSAEYMISGTVLGTDNHAIADAEVLIKEGVQHTIISDTVHTDKSGRFTTTFNAWPAESLVVVAKDVRTNLSDSVRVGIRLREVDRWQMKAKAKVRIRFRSKIEVNR